MHIQSFNTQAAPPPTPPGPPDQAAGRAAPQPDDMAVADPRMDAEIAFLRARIEHLELVIETARGLMTANQERLLRRLHDVPQEMMALSARLSRISPHSDNG